MPLRLSLAATCAILALPAIAWSADAAPGAGAPAALTRPVPPGLAPALPAPLNALGSQVVGVVGSGDKIGLIIREGEISRTLHPGDTYQDGWVLTGLTPEVATLSKAGQSRQVGLNPGSAIAQRDAAAPTQVTTVGAPKVDPAAIEALMQQLNASGMNIPGMDAAATQQMLAQARDYMATPAGQAAIAQAYQRAVTQYGQGAIDQFMAQPGRAAGAPRGGAGQ